MGFGRDESFEFQRKDRDRYLNVVPLHATTSFKRLEEAYNLMNMKMKTLIEILAP